MTTWLRKKTAELILGKRITTKKRIQREIKAWFNKHNRKTKNLGFTVSKTRIQQLLESIKNL